MFCRRTVGSLSNNKDNVEDYAKSENYFYIFTFQSRISLDFATLFIFALQPSFTLKIYYLVIDLFKYQIMVWSEGYLAIFFELLLSAVKVDKPGQGNSIERDWGLVKWVGFNSKSLLLHAGESFQMWKASK